MKSLEFISCDQADFFKELLKIKEKAKELITKDKFCLDLQGKDLEERLEKGLPLLTFPEIPFKNNLLEEIFQDICSIIKRYNSNTKSEIDSLSDSFKDKKLSLEQFIKDAAIEGAVSLDAISKKTGINKNTLMFVATQLAKPFFESCAESLNFKMKDDQWLKGYCPVCGSQPLMAKFRRDDGKRILKCSLCATEWAYLRMKCPSCENDDMESLRFLFVDNNSPYRVDVCDKCKRYIKTIDERKLPKNQEVDLVIEDIATSYLDILAEKEKYGSFYSDQLVAEVS